MERISEDLLRLFPWYPDLIKSSGIPEHPLDYAEKIVKTSILATCFSAATLAFLVASGVPARMPGLKLLALILVITLFPTVVFLLQFIILPSFKKRMKIKRGLFDLPYAAMYAAVLVKGLPLPRLIDVFDKGLSNVFPHFSRVLRRTKIYVEGLGIDYLTALSKTAEAEASGDLRDFLAGFTTTVRAGGTISDYVYEKATTYFDELVVRIKASANTLSMFVYAYLTITVFTTLTLTLLYVSSSILQYQASLVSLPLNSIVLTLGVGIPFLTFAVLLAMDATQYTEPTYERRHYMVLAATLWVPICLFLLGMFYNKLPLGSPLRFYGVTIAKVLDALGLKNAYYNGLMVAVTLLVWSTIVGRADLSLTRTYSSLNQGVISFFRDLTEVRKTGLPLEKCLATLSKRDYGAFTGFLREMTFKFSVTPSLSRVVESVGRKVPVWRARMFLYLLRDAIEAGGGTSQAFEAIAQFLEKIRVVDKEHSMAMKPLMIVPYIGGLLILFSTIALISFAGTMASSETMFYSALRPILPLLALDTWLMGFIVGKAGEGRTIAGFKHAALLALAFIFIIPSGEWLIHVFAKALA